MEENKNLLKPKFKFDYSWIIIGISFLMVFTVLGFTNSVKGTYVVPVTEYLGIDRFTYSFVDSCRYIAVAVVNIFFGTLVNKFGPRKLIGAGFASVITAVLFFALSENIWLFYVGGIFLGIGFAFTTTSIVGVVVNRWCTGNNKATIMGFVLASSGLGGAVASPIVSYIIGSSGYKASYLTVAVILTVVGTLAVLLLRDKPKNSTEQGAGAKTKRRGKEWVGISFSEALKKPYFYLIILCIFFTGLLYQGTNSIWQPHLNDIGMDKGYVSLVLSISSITLAAFKILAGVFYDKFGLRFVSTLCICSGIAVMIALSLVTNTPEGMALAMFYGIFASLTSPLETVVLPIYAKDLFGEKAFNHMLGICVSANTAGSALGGIFFNFVYKSFELDNYTIPLQISAIGMLAVVLIVQYVITKAHRTQKEIEAKAEASCEAEVLEGAN